MLGAAATTILGGYAQLFTTDEKTKFALAIAATTVGSVTSGCHLLRKYAVDSITENTKNLENVILERHEVFDAQDAQSGAVETV
jgi:hypothetical protein